MVAPRTPPASDSRAIYENGDGDFRGYYEDGAYVASSQQVYESEDRAEAAELDQQLRYFNLIISRYEALRTQLQQIPPLETIQKLGQDHPTHVGKLTVTVARWWRWNMRTVDPKPAQIASMEKSTVLRLLGLLTGGTLLKRGAKVEVGVSRWAWSLLARLPERGELTSEEIGAVRELGKKAVLIGMGLRKNKNWEEGMKEVEKELDEEEREEPIEIVNEDEIELDFEDDNEDLDDTEAEVEPLTRDLTSDGAFIGPQVVVKEDKPSAVDDETDGVLLNEAISVNSLSKEDGEVLHAEYQSEEEGELPSEEYSEGSETLAAARARLLAQIDQERIEDAEIQESTAAKIKQATNEKMAALWNTRATVDMIITVAGEVYGQRDLLEFRGAWEE